MVITVTDHGGGIDDDGLFSPFVRGAADGIEGGGLGLYVVRSLVAGMRGIVEAQPGPSRGARMRIELPLAPPSPT